MRNRAFFSCVAATVLLGTSSPAFAIGDFGPDTCMEGLVWREACGAGDHVCVGVTTRTDARADNAAARSRVQPGGGPYGPDTCKQGYVWREACGSADHVCVLPKTRDSARIDNAQAAGRKKYPYCTKFSKDALGLAVGVTSSCIQSTSGLLKTADQYFKFCLNSSPKTVGELLQGLSTELQACRDRQGGTVK